ncbi:uncharacterized protein LOC116664447 [Camelus ferus]|uniref:Uncharacterized protein LOC116664447 n=1 Tax=Camelus ferus TaxID=419612 RepID=A0A8B8T9M8_CAMFR|nr:uncharacterized protein LOC116664447 [Camelus ferus]
MCTQLASRTEPPRPPPRPGLVRLAGGGNHTCLINLKAGPRRHPGPAVDAPLQARRTLTHPGTQHWIRIRLRRQPHLLHLPRYSRRHGSRCASCGQDVAAPTPPARPCQLTQGGAQTRGEDRGRRRGETRRAGGGAGPAAGVSTWGGGKDVPEAPPARAQPADPDLDPASPPRSLRRSLRAQRLGLSGNILPRSQLSTSYGTLECKTRWPPEPGEQVASSGQKLQKPGMRHAHELLSRKYQ